MKKLLILLLALPAFADEFWVSPYPSPQLPNYQSQFPLGNVENPYDGSNQARFDTVMSLMPAGSVIHINAGTNQTGGTLVYGLKAGQKVVGAGMDQTVLQFAPSLITGGFLNRKAVIGTQSLQIGITVEDLTLDGNYQPGSITTLFGASMWGGGFTFRRVHFRNFGSFTTNSTLYVEGFIFAVNPVGLSADQCGGNLVEDCVFDGYTNNFNNNASAVSFFLPASGIVKGITVTQSGTNAVHGVGFGSGSALLSSTFNHVDRVFYCDNGPGITNCVFSGNTVNDCAEFIGLYNGYYSRFTVVANNINLGNHAPYIPFSSFMNSWNNVTNSGFLCAGNSVWVNATNPSATMHFLNVSNLSGLVTGNILDPAMSNTIAVSPGLVFTNNLGQ